LPEWQRRLAIAAGCTAPGLFIRLGGGAAPALTQVAAYGAAVVAASFILAWACEAAQVDVAHGLVVAIVAFVAILPEYIVELHFAFTAQAQYVAANLTGASRLLLGCAVALPGALAVLGRGRVGRIELPAAHRLEVGVLLAAAAWSLRGVFAGRLTLVDSLVLGGLYVVYLRRTLAGGVEASEPQGVAAALAALPRVQRHRWSAALMAYAAFVVLLTAVPFGDAVLAAGSAIGISPFLMLQWIVPLATETPELVVATVLLTHGRGGQSVAVLIAGAVSQYTLALGTLPAAYRLGAGVGPLPLAGRERVELFLTAGVALYAVAAFVSLRLSRGDSSIMLVLFAGQLLVPTVFTRLLFAVAFWAVGIDVLVSERRTLGPLFSALAPARARARPARRARSRRGRWRRPSPAAVADSHSPPR
jgi:cation:H+ antiporter